MPTRFPVFAALLAAGIIALTAPSASAAALDTRMTLQTHWVGKLIVPQQQPIVISVGEGDVAPSAAPQPTQEAELIKLIVASVAPTSWQQNGGCGAIGYIPFTMSLAVKQTPEVQEQIADLLAALRRLNDQMVALEVRWVTVADDFCLERIGVDFGNETGAIAVETPEAVQWLQAVLERPAKPVFLNEKQVFQLLDSVQGDKRTNVMRAPKITLFNGQTGVLHVSTEANFVTGVDVAWNGKDLAFQPKTTTVKTGTILTAQPVISADQRFVRIGLKSEQTDLVLPVPSTWVKFPVKGTDGTEETLTQLVQLPTVNTKSVQVVAKIPDGGTILLGGFEQESEVRTEFGPPILSEIPYLNRLFRTIGYGRETKRVFMMVTPRIIVQEEEEERSTGNNTPVMKGL